MLVAMAMGALTTEDITSATALEPELLGYVVLFDFDSAEISPGRQQTINEEVATAAASRARLVYVTGHADRAGPVGYNLALSLRRAEAVRRALIARGISPGRITVSGRGEEEPAFPTPDGVREQANRRVEVIIE
jgi:OOP family OmpA-OmpF porin